MIAANDDTLARIGAVASTWEAACRSRDPARIADHLAAEATVWYNYEPAREHDKASYRDMLEKSAKTFRKQRYADMRVHLHPRGFVEQATLIGETDKGEIAVPFLLIATVEGDKIVRIQEYFDTTIMHQAGMAGG